MWLSWQHGRNLGLFVFIYKLIQCFLTNLTGKRRNIYAFIAGILGASVIWRERTAINQQICFYLISRVGEGIIKTLRKKDKFPKESKFGYVSMFIWGMVMYLFERDKSTLQNSLTSSMTFLYHDSDRNERGWRDFVPFEFPPYDKPQPRGHKPIGPAPSMVHLNTYTSQLTKNINKVGGLAASPISLKPALS